LTGLLIELGDGHRRAGRYPEAVEALERARSLRTGEAAALCTMLGIVAKELGAFDWAAYWYARVATIHAVAGAVLADEASLQHNLAGLAHAEGRFADAEVHARRAVALRRQVAGQHRSDDVDVAADRAV